MPPKNSQNKAAESLGLWHPKACPCLSTGNLQHKANRQRSSPELSGSVLFTSHTAGVTEMYCAHFWMCCFSSVLPHRNPHPYYGSTTVTLPRNLLAMFRRQPIRRGPERASRLDGGGRWAGGEQWSFTVGLSVF